jgi:hypothetical protein
MPSLVARRNCNATISSSPLQDVAPKATQLTPIARASSSFCDRTLATPHRGHASSPSPALTMSGLSSQALSRSCRRGCTNESLGARTSKGRHGVPARRPSPRTSRMSLRAFIHRRRGGRRLHRCAWRLARRRSRSLVIMATISRRRYMRQCYLGENTCRL